MVVATLSLGGGMMSGAQYTLTLSVRENEMMRLTVERGRIKNVEKKEEEEGEGESERERGEEKYIVER